jgi:predicted O-linked N-acetylglucosamine transferase (SPINDLY family)
VAASILGHAGLSDLVAASDADFVGLAVRACTDAAWRDAMRSRVRAALSDPSLTDPVRYARALERAWERVVSPSS